MDIDRFLENLENLIAAESQRFAADADHAPKSAERSVLLALCAAGSGDTQGALNWIHDAIRLHGSTDFVSFASAHDVWVDSGEPQLRR